MKCDTCKSQLDQGCSPDEGCTGAWIWCAKGHWEGHSSELSMAGVDSFYWDNCPDYEAKTTDKEPT